MTIPDILYTILISPLQLFFEILYMMANKIIHNPGMSIIVLSLTMNFLVLPLYRRADAMQEEERDMEAKLHDGVAHIKKTFKGDEKMMILQTFYRQNNYKPTYVFKGSISLFLEIPFFIAAYQFLSHLQLLRGVHFGVIADLGAADALIAIGGFHINLLPIIMTAVNLVSCIIFTKGYPTKTKVQLYVLAIFFFIFLYSSPAGLVFYWTLNNIFSLVKTIFYKLKNAKKILHIMFAFAGVALVICAVRFLYTGYPKRFICVIGIGIAFMIPLIISVIKKYGKLKLKPLNIASNRKVYFAGAIFMVVLIGCVIPSAVLEASPQEFVDIYYYVNPLWNICSSLCFSIGTFLVWMGVFYWLTNKKYKAYFEISVWIICGITTLDYMLFGRNLGILSNALKFENGMHFTSVQKLQNLAVVLGVAVILFVLYRFGRKIVPQVLIVCILALSAMSIYNVVKINESVSVVEVAAQNKGDAPSFSLSKSGKNVIVLMMDRAMNEYIPYLMNEKPQLKNEFSGFTYYPNTFSFGGFTNFGTPALFGGYEYTPLELNKRNTETLKSKQNEALKVMPVLFDQNHYNVTVCDPTYANYQYIPDLSIYNKYPDIHKYITLGRFQDKESKAAQNVNNKRNFFCYSIMKTVPLFAQSILYDNGNYNSQTRSSQVSRVQKLTNNYVADGLNSTFMNAYSVLENLSNMTKIRNDNTNTFLMMTNDSTHEPTLLQEPNYVPAEHVDNTAYETKNANRFTVDGKTLKMETGIQYMHYQANMASMLMLGEWLDYLKKNNVYDNTRIIIVADHGRPLGQLNDMVIKDSKDELNIYDSEFYYPLLLVKDFNSNKFSTSEQLMTNGDVPTLAMKDLIKNPKNPFTGKEINDNAKHDQNQYVLGSLTYDIAKNNGNIYLPGTWFKVHGDVRNKNNWSIVNENATSPIQK